MNSKTCLSLSVAERAVWPTLQQDVNLAEYVSEELHGNEFGPC